MSKNPARNWNGWQNPLILSKNFPILIKKGITVAVVSTKLYPDEIVKECIIVYSHFRDMCAVVQSDPGFKLLSFLSFLKIWEILIYYFLWSFTYLLLGEFELTKVWNALEKTLVVTFKSTKMSIWNQIFLKSHFNFSTPTIFWRYFLYNFCWWYEKHGKSSVMLQIT